MALNPAFDSHSSRKLPLAFGYVQGSGDQVLHTIAPDNSRYAISLMAEGEWDGYEMLALVSGGHLENGTKTLTTWAAGLPPVFHFYRGTWSTKNLGNRCTSTGFAQSYDQWFPQFPTVTPPQCFSGIAYSSQYIPGTTPLPFGSHVLGTATSDITNVGIWRSTRCRIFDASGNVLAYSFTCNPAWQIVEAILRYKIKPQQPPLAGLNAAEKACFNWPSIVAFANRNDVLDPNGFPAFFFSGIFAADATLTNILETILRCSRAYMREVDNQIYLFGDDARDPIFAMTANHIVPGSLKLGKKDLSRAPNQFIPRYRDIDMPAISQVATATNSTMADGVVPVCKIVANSLSPFLAGDIVTYGGATDPSFNGSYNVVEPEDGGAPAAYIPFETYGLIPSSSSASTTGGYLGTNDARFSERAPTGVQHRSHQRMIAMQAPGLAALPKVVPVYYDMGNSTFGQTNRIMKFEMVSLLGPDPVNWTTATSTPVHGTPITDPGADVGLYPLAGPGPSTWIGPIAGTLTAYLDAVDANGAYLKDVHVHDVISLDDWASPEFPGPYIVKKKTVTAPTDQAPGLVELDLYTYFSHAYTNSVFSDLPGDSYQTVPGQTFQLTGFTPVTNPAWTLIAGPCGVRTVSGGTVTWAITIPDLVMQLMGVDGVTPYATFSVTGVPDNTNVVLYVDDLTSTGGGVSFGFQIGTSLTTQPPGRYIVLIGSFTNVIPFGTVVGGNGTVLFQPA